MHVPFLAASGVILSILCGHAFPLIPPLKPHSARQGRRSTNDQPHRDGVSYKEPGGVVCVVGYQRYPGIERVSIRR
jgi:hypothetical protein